MKKILLGAAAFVAWAFAVPASAAEIDGGPIPPDFFTAPPAFAPPRAYNWTGVYIGINAGGGWGNPHWDTSPWPSTLMDGNYSLSGGLFGGTLGYNLQAGTSSFVIGGEVISRQPISKAEPLLLLPRSSAFRWAGLQLLRQPRAACRIAK